MPTKPCDDELYEGFYDAAATSRVNIEKFKEGKALTCVDLQGSEIDIYGTWVLSADYAALDMMAVPCGTQFEEFPHEIRDDCIWNKTEVLEYMGLFQSQFYYNSERFQSDEFGENRIR